MRKGPRTKRNTENENHPLKPIGIANQAMKLIENRS